MNRAAGAVPGPIEAPDAASFSIRPARPEDALVLVNLVRELAVYEKLEEYVRATPDDFRRHLFGPRPAAEAALAEVASEPVGFALWFTTFSTFRGQPGLYLEDLFVRPGYRGRGIGKGLLGRCWPGWLSSAGADGWNGQCWTGTRRRSASTVRWAHGRWMMDNVSDRRRAAPPLGCDVCQVMNARDLPGRIPFP